MTVHAARVRTEDKQRSSLCLAVLVVAVFAESAAFSSITEAQPLRSTTTVVLPVLLPRGV